MERNDINTTLSNRILYDSAFVCAVCQSQAVQIHHIDHNNSNSVEDNLIALCTLHHNEAHTVRENTNNLSAARLKYFRNRWVEYVIENRNSLATATGQSSKFSSPMWGYVNHNRLIQSNGYRSESVEGIFNHCLSRGLIDELGIVVAPNDFEPAKTYLKNTIYDRFTPQDAQRIHKFYCTVADEISRKHRAIYLDDNWWTKAGIKTLIDSGSTIFVNESFYFKGVSKTRSNEHRLVHRTRGKVKLQFYVDTEYMYGDTSMEISFKGCQAAAALLIVKSINETDDGFLVIECTPLALGVAFSKFYPSPIG